MLKTHNPPPCEYRWHPSKVLFVLYGAVQAGAGIAVCSSAAPWGVKLALGVVQLLHALWVVPRCICLRHSRAWKALRHDQQGWALWSVGQGWQPIELRPDTWVHPCLIVLRYRRAAGKWTESCCIPSDALPSDQHRRLRVQLRFSRHRWQEPK